MSILTRILVLFVAISLSLPLAELTTVPVIAKNHHRSAHADKSKSVQAEKSQTQTFSNTTAITIPAVGNASPFPSTIQASGFKKGTVQDVNVTLTGFSHTFSPDVGVLLQAPNGQATVLMQDAGDTTDVTNLTLTFDDEAASPPPFNAPLVSGTFKPATGPFPSVGTGYPGLFVLDGGNPNGSWQLFVVDDTGGDSGSISGGWSLTIQAKLVKEKKKHKKH